ncbi:MAG: hypothetical protein ACD_46C00628G0004 [uncultured bacterium]|nr:MAG: hypothetical protein ACD_46C00628G0004 [uncultured bacterium]
MSCGKCGNGSMCLCPFSFGLALGITCSIVFFFWAVYAMSYGMPEMMKGSMMAMPELTWSAVGIRMLWMLLKGFVIGFVFALIYDFIVTRCKGWCCKKDASCCDKTEAKK